ncbi:heat shock protein 60, mitochondrial precursor [Pochonia chlamydosporia 170]|uniref:Heat shock protein 60, mitochondrial n=1 Tax=Pochonia chlamydosporia 170 TaxID=1380566 RepID=A0A179G5U9_METCM|nr:heat shock protein 60, mitochondrial precursor [Pochonia chlamydosporia 170]OAQ72900.1 heat shock protein 60, mitochondrial precursor [Pochonia chlamydosporia 170]
MQRALSSRARATALSSVASRYRAGAGLSQQLRFAHKELKFGVDGRAALLAGVDTLAKAVATTLGPKGRNVLIESSFGSPKITKDGVTVAKAVSLKDKFENLGARLLQDVASKTNDVAGDGTTTATVLARAIFSETVKNVAAGCNPMDLRRGIQAAVDSVVEYLHKHKRDITTSAEIAQVATISANGDHHVGQMIANAMEKVGKEGVITVKEGKTMLDELEVTEGMRFDRGFVSPYFITDTKAQKVEFENPLILLSEKKISAVQDIIPALEISTQTRRPLVIIAEDIEGEALAVCILNKLRGQLQVAAVKAPGFGDNRKSILGDIGVLTKGTVFTDELDIKLEKATIDMLGSTGSITITKEDTIILNGEGTKDAISQRCEQIRGVAADPTTSEYEKEKLQERLAKLSGGVAVIKVGGSSEVEVGEKKDRFVDALNATRAAVEEGILPGGGTALIKASAQALHDVKAANFDQQLGVNIVKNAITRPARTIIENAGMEGSVVIGKLTDEHAADFNKGFDSAKGEYVDMIQAGILDPLKVVRTGLIDASGVASLLGTTEVAIVEAPEEKGPGGPPMGVYVSNPSVAHFLLIYTAIMVSSGAAVSEEAVAATKEVGKKYKYAILHYVNDQFELEEASDDKNYENFANKLINCKSKSRKKEFPGTRFAYYNFIYDTEDGRVANSTVFFLWSPDVQDPFYPWVRVPYTSAVDVIKQKTLSTMREIHDPAQLLDMNEMLKLASTPSAQAVRLHED